MMSPMDSSKAEVALILATQGGVNSWWSRANVSKTLAFEYDKLLLQVVGSCPFGS